jgi:hypothetical protein
MAEAKSKGRGEECISQNIRILRAPNGTQTIMFFVNSQRKERKRYISIPGEAAPGICVLGCHSETSAQSIALIRSSKARKPGVLSPSDYNRISNFYQN